MSLMGRDKAELLERAAEQCGPNCTGAGRHSSLKEEFWLPTISSLEDDLPLSSKGGNSLPLCIDLPGVSLPGADRLKPGETPGHGMATETLWQ
jgi:hypothetical protein